MSACQLLLTVIANGLPPLICVLHICIYPSPKISFVWPLNNKHLHIFWIYYSHRVCLYVYIPFMQYACVISVPLADSNSIWAATSSICIAYPTPWTCFAWPSKHLKKCNFAEPQIWFEMIEWLYLKCLLGAVSTSPLYRAWRFHKGCKPLPQSEYLL